MKSKDKSISKNIIEVSETVLELSSTGGSQFVSKIKPQLSKKSNQGESNVRSTK